MSLAAIASPTSTRTIPVTGVPLVNGTLNCHQTHPSSGGRLSRSTSYNFGGSPSKDLLSINRTVRAAKRLDFDSFTANGVGADGSGSARADTPLVPCKPVSCAMGDDAAGSSQEAFAEIPKQC